MAERVTTGGTKDFVYSGKVSELDDERKKEIEKGYQEYNERKERERKRRNWIIGFSIIAGILILLFLFFKFF